MVMKLAVTVLFFTLLLIGGVSAGVEFAGEPKDEIFNTLSASEIDSLIAYLKAEGVVDFNRWEVDDEDKSLNSNYAMVYSAMAPPKAEALAYLDADGPMPERFAAVTVNRGGATPRDVMDYKVGPLVNGTLSEIASYETMYEDGMIPWAKRASTPIDWNWLEDSVAFNAFVLQDLFKNVTGGFCYGSDEDYEEGDCGYDDVTYWEYASLSATTELRDTAVHFWLIPDGTDWGYLTLHPVPISWNFIEDPEKPQTEWVSYNFEYCYQGPYDSAEDLLAAFNAGELTMCYVPSTDLGYSRTDPIEPFRVDSEIAAPKVCSPMGERFAVESANAMSEEMITRKLADDAMRDQHFNSRRLLYSRDNKRRDTATSPSAQRLRQLKLKQVMVDEVEAEEEGEAEEEVSMEYGDGTGHFVSWLDWSFHVSVDPYHGMRIYDLKFKGERIAYEISTQEYFASYSSAGSVAQVSFYDSNYEIGTETSPLQRGIDCPEDALYLPVLLQEYEGLGFTKPDALCIYEAPTGEALWRHGYTESSGVYGDDEIRGLPRTMLNVRQISTMSNYDYLNTFSVMVDGVVEMNMEMGGYLLSSFAPDPDVMENPESPLFAPRVFSHVSGILHDHLICYKVDLDILGTSNRLETGKVTYGTYMEATGKPKPPWHSFDGVRYMDLKTVETETAFSIGEFDQVAVYSDEKNMWGEYRGYELAFQHTVHSTALPRDHPMIQHGAWMFHNVDVTVQKDEEPYCTFPSIYNSGTAYPRYDLDAFKDGESVVDEDIVLWIMVGKEHYPKSEDLPLISNFGSGFILKPRNYFDRAGFSDIPDYVEVVEGAAPAETHGKGKGSMGMGKGKESGGKGMAMKMKMMGKGKME